MTLQVKNTSWRQWEDWRDACHIPNDALTLDDLPEQSEDWSIVKKFAMSFDGLNHWGSFSKCADVVFENPQETLTAYRTALFLQHRKQRHLGQDPDDRTMQYIQDLIERIRAKVIAGQID